LTLAAVLRGIVCQRLIPTIDGGTAAALEILINTGRIAERISDPDKTQEIKEVIADGGFYGMETFDQSVLALLKSGKISVEAALKTVSNVHDFELSMHQAGITVDA
jgi:twitching motility protein PilT